MEDDWNLICRAAPKLTQQYGAAVGLQVTAKRRRSLTKVTEGFAVDSSWMTVWEPVRERSWFSRSWWQIQSVQQAASEVGWFFRNWPEDPPTSS